MHSDDIMAADLLRYQHWKHGIRGRGKRESAIASPMFQLGPSSLRASLDCANRYVYSIKSLQRQPECPARRRSDERRASCPTLAESEIDSSIRSDLERWITHTALSDIFVDVVRWSSTEERREDAVAERG